MGLELTTGPTRTKVSLRTRGLKSQQDEAPHACAIDKSKHTRRAGGVKGGKAAERSEGTLDAGEHRDRIEARWRSVSAGAIRSSAPCTMNRERPRRAQGRGAGFAGSLPVQHAVSSRLADAGGPAEMMRSVAPSCTVSGDIAGDNEGDIGKCQVRHAGSAAPTDVPWRAR